MLADSFPGLNPAGTILQRTAGMKNLPTFVSVPGRISGTLLARQEVLLADGAAGLLLTVDKYFTALPKCWRGEKHNL